MKFSVFPRAVASLAVCAVAVGGFAETYTPVEFIVSTGYQYADTGVRLNPKLSRVDARFVMMTNLPSTIKAADPCAIAGSYFCSPNPTAGMDNATDFTYNNRALNISQAWIYDNQSKMANVECLFPNFVRSNNQLTYRQNNIGSDIAAHQPYWIHQWDAAMCYINNPANNKGYAGSGTTPGYSAEKKDCWVGNCYLSTVNKVTTWDNVGSGTLIGEPYNSEGSMAQIKWYGFQISTNDVLQADLIPAQRKSDSVYGFYDRVRKTFHPSKTSTPFVGPTICPWVPSSAEDPMDASHFTGSVPSGKLDVISIPANTTLVIPSSDVAAKMKALGGIRLEAATSACVFDGLASAVTFYTPFYGDGSVQFLNSAGNLAIRGDSSDFRGRFAITNAFITVGWQRSFGVTNSVTIHNGYNNVGSRRVDFTCGGAVYQNEFHFERVYNSSQNSVVYSVTSGSEFAGPNYFPCLDQVWFQHGDVNYIWSGPIYPEGNTYNIIRCNSRANGTKFTGADKWLGMNTLYLLIATPISCLFHATHKTFDQTKSPPGNIRMSNTKILTLYCANAFDEDFGILFDSGSPASGGINLNGYDQRIGRLNLNVPLVYQKNVWVPSYSGELYPDFNISTPTDQPATLTIREGWFLGYGQVIDNYPGWFPGKLVGPVSIILDIKSEYPLAPLRFVTENDTTGMLAARRGTITIGADAKFENLSCLEASNEGQIVIESPYVATGRENGLETLILTNRPSTAGVPLTIASGCTLVTRTAQVGEDRWMAAGTYTSAIKPKYIAGDGTLVVKEYGGKKAFIISIK